MTWYISAVQKQNAAVLLRKPGRLASQYAKKDIINRFNRGERNFFDIFHCGSKIVTCFKMFCKRQEFSQKLGFKPDLMFHVMPKYQIEAFVDIAELKERKVEHYEAVWKYNYFELTKLNSEDFIGRINEICEK